jgi:hypothetical protein
MRKELLERAAQYRREAEACLEVAKRVSVQADRMRMEELAQNWLKAAVRAEEEANSFLP